MTRQETYQSKDYARAAAAIIAVLPPERAAEVYDFARFLQAQKASPSPIAANTTDDWLHDSEEQLEAEDAVWDEFYAGHRDKFIALREAAHGEISAGTTEPMFDDHTAGSLTEILPD
jgi:hypothetical protein